MGNKNKAIVKQPKENKIQRTAVLLRLLYFVLAGGCIASTIILTMLISDTAIQTATNVVGAVTGASATYFVLKLIFS